MEIESLPVFYTSLAIVLVYISIIGRLTYGWLKLEQCEIIGSLPVTMVSIIIPVRNEESAIGRCLSGLLMQEYPGQLMEIIVIDDHSVDATLEIVRGIAGNSPEIRISVLSLTLEEGKKAAIQLAVKFASGSLILCTDADCIHPHTWVGSMVNCFENRNPVFISGPVLLHSGNDFFGRFQEVEFMSLVASGAGAIGVHTPIMCNGANLGFSAEAYRSLKTDAMKSSLASGDDVFLMLAMKEAYGAKKILFVKNKAAIVTADAADSIAGLLRQRFRWASKSKAYRDGFLILTAVSVFAMNALIVATALAGLFDYKFLFLLLMLFIIKLAADLPLLILFGEFAGKKRLTWFIPIALPVVALFTTVSAVAGNLGNVKWKGR
ncbi:MAG: glycosyltransferase [Bacteroidales bacterium]|nr:glycosyltransferase [Bacteroidales bacterium]